MQHAASGELIWKQASANTTISEGYSLSQQDLFRLWPTGGTLSCRRLGQGRLWVHYASEQWSVWDDDVSIYVYVTGVVIQVEAV